VPPWQWQIKSCALFIPVISRNTHERDEGYFRLEWKLAIDRSHLITANRAFLLPVVIDETRDDDENVPDKFRELQWTRLPAGETPPAFIERVKRLLSPESSTATRLPGTSLPSPAGLISGALLPFALAMRRGIARQTLQHLSYDAVHCRTRLLYVGTRNPPLGHRLPHD